MSRSSVRSSLISDRSDSASSESWILAISLFWPDGLSAGPDGLSAGTDGLGLLVSYLGFLVSLNADSGVSARRFGVFGGNADMVDDEHRVQA